MRSFGGTEIDVLVAKLDEVADEVRRLQRRADHVVGLSGQTCLWDDNQVVDLKAFVLELLEQARWCPEPTWPRIRRQLVEQLEARLWVLIDALALPELADIDDIESLLFEVEAETYRLLRMRATFDSRVDLDG